MGTMLSCDQESYLLPLAKPEVPVPIPTKSQTSCQQRASANHESTVIDAHSPVLEPQESKTASIVTDTDCSEDWVQFGIHLPESNPKLYEEVVVLQDTFASAEKELA